MIAVIEKRADGIVVFEMKNDDICVRLMNLGAHVLSVVAKDREGTPEDVVLGFADVSDYYTDENRFGAVIGRVANRIKGARFTLNGTEYHLAANDGENHLHGGICGFEKKLFSYETNENEICFTYVSPDGEEGYPGELKLQVKYQLLADTLKIRYEAVCDQDTLLNVTNHMYFNLSGMKEKIGGHDLYINADRYAEIGKGCLPNGRFPETEGTPFDFRTFRRVGEYMDDPYEQLRLAGGYDHALLLCDTPDNAPQIILRHTPSGRSVKIRTDMPTVQVYTGNWISGEAEGKCGRPYEKRDGIALETQFLPDSIHLEKDAPVILKAGETFRSETSYTFSCDG